MLEKDRINELIEVVMKVAEGDYSAQVELSGKNDELDSLAMGLNMMIDDIRNEITEREKAEERIEHINAILLAIRNVNQLIAKERDRDKLLKGACENLIETRGYYDAWIALLDESGMLVTTAEAGLGEDFLPVVEWLKSGKLTVCSQKALKRKEVISIVDPSSTCADCPLAGKYIDKGAMSIRLEYGRKIYGLLSVSVPRDFVSDEEEKALFSEIAGDIAFALYNIEVEEERKKVEEALQKRTHDLDERVKELSCLYGIDEMCRKEGATIEEVLKKVPQIIPPSLQYPDSTESCITFEGNKYKSRNFKKTKWIQSADIIIRKEKIGLVEVCYLEEKPKRDEGPFLKEERDLINAVAERLSQFIGHKQAEADLKNSEERYKDLVEKAGIAILIDDENGKITYANQKAEELYGYSIEEMKNQSIQSLVHPDDIKKVAQFHNDRLRGKEAPSSYEFKGIKNDGSIIYVELDVVELKVKERAIGTRLYLKDITERKKAEEEMRMRGSVIESSINAVAIASLEGSLTYVNNSFLKMWGYDDEEEVIGRPATQFWQMEEKAEEVMESLRNKGSWVGELAAKQKDGSQFDVQLSSTMVKDENGRLICMMASFLDITDQKKAAKELKDSEERLKIMFEYAPDGYYLNDFKGNFIDGNRAAEKLTGYKRDELAGKSFLKLKLLPLKEIPKAATLLAKNALGQPTGPDEFTLKRKDGTRAEVEIRTFPVKIKGKTLVLGNVRDITVRKRREEVLSYERDLMQTLFDNIPDFIYFKDNKARFHRVNKRFCDLFGRSMEDIIGKTDLDLFPEEIANETFNEDLNVIKTGKPIINKEEGGEIRDGVEEWVLTTKIPWVDKDGNKQGLFGISRDITERKQAQEQIKASLKEKEVLLKEIHHRVKNNMQIISSLLNIQSANIEDENMREIFNVCQSRIRSMALMHETLYKSEDLARIDFSEYIRRLTTHLMSMYRVGMEPIRLNLDIVDVYLDINRAIPCGMIINELVSNSLKHAFPDGKGGEVAVKMFADKKKKVTLIVSDTGVGFPEGMDFHETKSMGMQLVTDLTRQIKGTIKLGRDKGTEFKIVF